MILRIAALALLAAAGAQAAPDLPLTAAAAHPLAGRIVATADGAALDADALAAALAAADVIVLGETHDNPDHHAAQAWLVRAAGAQALAFEMVGRDREGRLARARAEGGDLAAALDWANSGWPDWAMYAPIFAAAPDAPVTGGALPRDALARAMRDGAAAAARAAIGAAAPRYGLDAALDPAARAEAAAEQIAAHCGAIPESVAGGMVEAQRLRDAAFADAALRARALAGEGRVALIAGAGHARRDRGAPAFVAAAEPGLSVATLAMVEIDPGREDWRAYNLAGLVDYLWFTAAAPRADPCAAFLQRRN